MLRTVPLVLAGVFAIICATMMFLCVRSYFLANLVVWGDNAAAVQVASVEGRLIVAYIDRTLSHSFANGGVGVKTDTRMAGFISGYLRQHANRHGFGFVRAHPTTAILFPYWLPILISGSLATVLGIRRMRRFSLRFMLFLTAMVAILLAVIVRR